MKDLHRMAQAARAAAWEMAATGLNARNAALMEMAKELEHCREKIFAANEADLEDARASDLSAPLVGRLKFGEEKLRQVRLEEGADKRPGQISGGQQQRTALARILASEPKVILLDEPFSALDSYLKYQLEVELAETLEQFPGTILWVSHDRNEVFRNCRRVCVLDQGKSQGTFTLRELFHEPVTEAAARLSGCKNYADAVPQGTSVSLPEWGLTLECGKEVSADISRIGIRAHHVTMAAANAPGAFPCDVLRVIQDVFVTIVLLRPEGAAPDAPPLRMELDRDVWHAAEDKKHVWVSIQPRDILLLK